MIGIRRYALFVDEVLLYVHRNRRFIRDGQPRTFTYTFTQLLSSVVRILTRHGIYLYTTADEIAYRT